MKLTGQFTGARLDLAKWKRRLRKRLDEKLNSAVRAWLGGVTGRVPVWSGMAQASLLAVSELVDGGLVISPQANVQSRIPMGRALGTATKEVRSFEYLVTIETAVPHYTYQETNKPSRGGSRTAPWHSLEVGAAAFLDVARDIRLPNLVFKPVVKKV